MVSTFTAAFVDGWERIFPDLKRQALPVFDGRTVCYPSEQSLKDYLAWRQSDAHINNQVGLDVSCMLCRVALPSHTKFALHATHTHLPAAVQHMFLGARPPGWQIPR